MYPRIIEIPARDRNVKISKTQTLLQTTPNI